MKKLFNKNTKFKVLTTLLVLVVMVACINVKSNVKATSYVYDFWKNVIPSAEGLAYVFKFNCSLFAHFLPPAIGFSKNDMLKSAFESSTIKVKRSV